MINCACRAVPVDGKRFIGTYSGLVDGELGIDIRIHINGYGGIVKASVLCCGFKVNIMWLLLHW